MTRSVLLYLSSYSLSLLGNGIASVLRPLLQRTGPVLAAALLATVTTATSALVGVFGGILADQFDRRRVVVAEGQARLTPRAG
ncbi:MAG: hypothetical protein EOP01_00525 [Propionibacteriaceae bacterium]|nr:MAG: hypothetical protein EOP01_00525 [Propionibacteriaceae bacterium]